MPRVKRWFKVNQDINGDPKSWELSNRFGVTGLRAWLECLSIADRNEGVLPGPWRDYVKILAARCQSTTRHLAAVCQWLTSESADGQQSSRCWVVVNSKGIASIPKWREYNRIQGPNKTPTRDLISSPPSEPSEPSEPSKKKKDNTLEDKSISERHGNGLSDWPKEDVWLRDLLERQGFLSYALPAILDPTWWNNVSEAVNGLEPMMMEREFGKMAAWLKENPGRKPTKRGIQRFIRTWLEKAEERERKLR